LIKGMLTIGSRFSPNYRASLIVYLLSIAIYIFSIAFHISLLKVGCKTMHVLIVWKNGMTFCIKEVIIPYSKYSHNHRNIFLKLCFLKMSICSIGTFQ